MTALLKYATETVEIERDCFAHEGSGPETIKRLSQAGATVNVDYAGNFAIVYGGVEPVPAETLAEAFDRWLRVARDILIGGGLL